MSAILVEIPADVEGPLEQQASVLNVDAGRYIAAVLREKLRVPVRIGDLEVFAPADILQYELNRAPGESEEQFDEAKDMYGRLFGAAMR
jgi:hypothetical protein